MSNEHNIIGFLLINKPKNLTSRDCINKLQKLLPKKTKIGHAGILDIFATGLLIVGIGREATRFFKYLMKLDKQYVTKATLGKLTNTLDYTGELVKTCDKLVTAEQIEQSIGSFGDNYNQIPPLFSALKWKGERLSDLTRSATRLDKSLDFILRTKQKNVDLYDMKLIHFNFPELTLFAHVSHGTYIRSLVNDVAQKCNSCATIYELERTAIGPFNVGDAVALQDLHSIEDIQQHIIDVDTVEQCYKNYLNDRKDLFKMKI
ncbi:MAG: tRNA pseudouridine(55) synthase TruB [Candidatus Dependentiae bacterium]